MKFRQTLFTASFLLFFLYLSAQFSLFACDFSGGRHLSLAYRELHDGEFQFQIANIIPLEKNLTDPTSTDTQKPYYIYLWDFGDCSRPSTQNTPLHRYEQPGNYTVKLIVKPIGSNDNQAMTCTLNIATTTAGTFNCNNYTPYYTLASNEALKLKPATYLNREGNPQRLPMLPQSGQFMVYAVQVKGGGINTTPKITFQFPTDALEFSVAYNMQSCTACNFASFDSYTQTSTNTAEVVYQLQSDMAINQQRTIYITLLVKPTVLAKTKIYCTATLDYQTGSSTPYLIQDDALLSAIANQSDNSKWADKDSLCSSLSEWITYKIKFKNTHTRTARNICLIDSLPNYADLSQIELLEVFPHQLPATRYHNYTACSTTESAVFATNNAFMAIDAPNRRITWELREVGLVGAESNIAAINPDISEGYIIYRVKVNGASMPFNYPLQTRTNIYLDGQWEAQTNWVETYRQATATCYCNVQDQTNTTSWIKKVRLYRTTGLPVSTTTYYIDNQSNNNNGYAAFTNSPPTIYKNTTYRMELTPDATTMNGSSFSWKVWIDADNNGLFDPLNEQFWGTTCSTTAIDFALTLPTEIPTGPNRIRVAMERGCDHTIDVCTGANAAEIEDYIVNITDYGQPDLTINIPAANDTIFAEAGNTETLQYTLRNIGTSPAYTGSIDKYYLSYDPFFDSSDTFVGQYNVGINLVEGDYLNIAQSFELPDTLSNGVYYLFIRTDANNLDIEIAEYNNYNRVVIFVCQNENNCRLQSPIKIYLQAAFVASSGQMTTSLAANQWLSMQQPYYGAPHYYGGNENLSALTSLPTSDICDWVLVELRSSSNPAIISTRKAAILHSNGQITDVNSNTLSLYADMGSYYIVVYHKSHLPVMSASTVSLSATNTNTYNFTDTPFKVFGNSSQTVNLGSAKYGLLAGDVNQDGIISKEDRNTWYTQSTNSMAGANYQSADLNMDGIVNSSDFNLLRTNTYRMSPYFLRK